MAAESRSTRRVAVVVKYYLPSPRISGIISYLSLVVEHLARRAEVHVVTSRATRDEPRELEIGGASVHRVDGPFPVRSAREVARLAPDATLVVSGIYDLRKAAVYFAPLSALPRSRAGRRVFYQATNVRAPAPVELGVVLRNHDAVLGASDDIVDSLTPRFGGRVHLVDPGIDVASLHAVEPERRRARHRVGFVNHLNHVKGADLALDAFVRLAGERDDVELVIAGTGDLAGEIGARVSGRPDFDVRGYLDDRERMALMASCDVVVLPFRTGVSVLGISQTVLECMALGAVVVGSRSGAIAPAITDGVDGLLFDEPGDIVPLVHGLLDDDARRDSLADAARARAGDFDVARRADALAAILGIA